jgi:hypothetical protein
MGKAAASSPPQARTYRLRSLIVAVPIVFLAAFHAILLIHRIDDASITHPLVAGRWIFAAALLIAVLAGRRVVSLRGRRAVAVVFWLLVAALHLAIPAGQGVFNATADIALIVEASLGTVPVLLALTVLLSASTIAIRAGTRRAAVLTASVPSRWPGCHGDRAPPLAS